jgi:lambda family phage portal protein
MGVFENLIERISPTWAARRELARETLAHARRSATYRQAWANRLGVKFDRTPQITGQRLRDRLALAETRDRAIAVDQNNPIGHGMLNRIEDNVVGEGFHLQGKTKSKDFNKEAQEKWRDWFDKADIRGLLTGAQIQRQSQRAHERDGDMGIGLVNQNGKSRLQLFTANQIRTPDGLPESPTMNSGVELDKAGRPIRFHLLESPEFGVRKFRPVPAQYFVYYPRFKTFDGVRGEPCFAQSFDLLDHIDGYVDGVAVAARMATIFGLLVKSGNSALAQASLKALNTANGELQHAVTLENGMLRYIGQKDDVVQVQASQPMQQTPDFIAAMLRLLGLPMDMPLELTLLDFSRVNYSSARASFLQFYQAMRPKQDYFRTMVLGRIYRWWISRAVYAGEFTTAIPENYWAHNFMARGWQWTDPLKDAQAGLLEVNMGINTSRRIAARLGRDYDELSLEQAADMAARRLMGFGEVFSTLTRDRLQPFKPPAGGGSAPGSLAAMAAELADAAAQAEVLQLAN